MLDLTTYTLNNLFDTIADDRHAVRDEVFRRAEKLGKKLARAQKKVIAMQSEMDAYGKLINAAS